MNTALREQMLARAESLVNTLATWTHDHPDADFAARETLVLEQGRLLLRALLADVAGAAGPRTPACPGCGMRSVRPIRRRRARTLQTRCGPIQIPRALLTCRGCGVSWQPVDRVLRLAPRQRTSSGVQHWEARLAGLTIFAEAATLLEELTGVAVGTETLRTHAERIGTELEGEQQATQAHVAAEQAPPPERYAPVADLVVLEADGVMVRYRGHAPPPPPPSRQGQGQGKGKGQGQGQGQGQGKGKGKGKGRGPEERPRPRRRAHQTQGPPRAVVPGEWHEVKLGLVAGWQEGALQAPSYVAAREPAERFARRLEAEAACRGALDVVGWRGTALDGGGHEAVLRRVLILGDGARWIWEEVAACFGCERIEIVDWYHASEHLWTVARALHGEGSPATEQWVEQATHRLWQHGPAPLLALLRATTAPTPAAAKVLATERGYFVRNAARMQYPTFRRQGLPIGSGPVEAEAKRLVQLRLKRPGMRWSDLGARAVLQLRCHSLSGRPTAALPLAS